MGEDEKEGKGWAGGMERRDGEEGWDRMGQDGMEGVVRGQGWDGMGEGCEQCTGSGAEVNASQAKGGVEGESGSNRGGKARQCNGMGSDRMEWDGRDR